MPNSFSRASPAFALLALCWANSALADHEHGSNEFEVFVAAEAIHGSGQTHPGEDDDTWFDADVVFGLTQHQFRVFGEYYITNEERDLERLQFGFEFVPETVLWLGRFHQPASAWNTEHHHGRFLQTAITRPFIERWEDEHGLIPQHITGALFESRQPLGNDSAIQISGGAGAGPGLTHEELEPISLIDNNPGRHRLSITSRIAYLPDYVGTSSAGLLFGHDHLSTSSPYLLSELRSSNVTLSIYGAYVDWNTGPWRVIGADYYVDAELDQAPRDESFISGYLQVERQLPKSFTVFSRIEDSARMQESRYVAQFQDPDGDIDIALRRQAIGLRWDYVKRQALTIELSHVVSLTQRSDEVRIQWSAVVP
ncbi:MAG TPA: hypothetical protein VKG63_02220 [Steroidobacteraceae bacterium]|nr:hypothetical protein [Steroidobacteraceae bacterium]